MNPQDHKTEGNMGDAWRSEVRARVRGHRARKRRRENGTLRLDFEGAAAPQPEPEPPAAPEPRREVCDTNFYRRLNQESMTHSMGFPARDRELEVAPAMELPEPLPPAQLLGSEPASALEKAQPPPLASERRKVITFPRPAIEPPLAILPSPDELADEVSVPRILEVPEDNAPAIAVQQSLFPIQLENAVEQQIAPPPQPQIEVPLQVANRAPRLLAEALDALLVVSASAIFLAMTWHTYAGFHHGRVFYGLLALAPMFFGALYQYLFLVHSGRTPGMKMMHLRLRRFDGRGAARRDRRRRAVYKILSAVSLGLGFLWALLDEDLLCWHDRITHTFLLREH